MLRNLLSLAPVLPLLLFISGCDLSSAEKVTEQTRSALIGYFPNTKVTVQKQVILALTCANGIGDELMYKTSDMLQAFPQLQQLRMLRQIGPFLGQRTYSIFALGFETGIVRYHVDSNSVDIIPASSIPNYETGYATQCGGKLSKSAMPYAYFGNWTVIYTDRTGQQGQLNWMDTLGIYSNEENAISNQSNEIESRIPLIKASLAENGRTYVSSTLVSVRRVSLGQSESVYP